VISWPVEKCVLILVISIGKDMYVKCSVSSFIYSDIKVNKQYLEEREYRKTLTSTDNYTTGSLIADLTDACDIAFVATKCTYDADPEVSTIRRKTKKKKTLL
jgi:hypothetical protein